ncbi:Yippee/Mis18 [Gongronella butleri]|nr:Yippee/Mis18 [Gongronella butleri]
MGLKYPQFLDGDKIYGCSKCRSHLATTTTIVCKEYAQSGPAYLFQEVVNIIENDQCEERHMSSGTHTIATICCSRCNTMLGWKYIKTCDDRQKYKEGKYILEKTSLAVIK